MTTAFLFGTYLGLILGVCITLLVITLKQYLEGKKKLKDMELKQLVQEEIRRNERKI